MADPDKDELPENPENPDEEKKEDADPETVETMEPDAEQEPEQMESEQETLNRIFMGEFDNLPAQASKLVRIFTSSTFTGTSLYNEYLKIDT